MLFSIIGIAAYLKDQKAQESRIVVSADSTDIAPILIDIDEKPEIVEVPEETIESQKVKAEEPITSSWPLTSEGLPTADRIEQLFTTSDKKLPVVKTISYKSRVPWMQGRPAWISDYATHFKTSRHFIARSLHGKGRYYKHDISNGDYFNVLDPDKDIEFYLLIDLSRCRCWFYVYDKDTHQRTLLKDYAVGLGRPDNLKSSGLLTPRGKYSLGDRIAAYKPKTTGFHNGRKVELIRTFGTRWIPFEKEISNTTSPAKGYGIHGVPWTEDPETGELKEDLTSLGTYSSDGCIRMASDDVEEVYAIIATKPSFVELVSDFHDAKLPGEEYQ